MYKFKIIISSIFTILVFTSCKDDALPKPAAQLRLEYPEPKYDLYKSANNFEFLNNMAASVDLKKTGEYSIHYPKMKATIYLTYKPVNGNLENLLRDTQKLTYQHVIKADEIIEQPFINPSKKSYGMFYQVGGNAATNAQFYVTDSIRNFISGSMYFYAKPNFDSILPAAEYVKNDMKVLMESIRWK